MKGTKDITFLLVDDELSILQSLENILKSHEFHVILASNVTEALQKLKLFRVDVCITDFNMPGGTGLDLIEKIRADNRRMNLPIILYSGSISEGAQAKISAYPFVQVLAKPASIDRLMDLIQRALNPR